jgi:ParB family chromosome partitioning protein
MAVTDLTTTTSTSPAKAVEVDPTTLEFDANVRTDMCLDRGFLSSLRERGVLEPIVCYHRDHDHTLVVLHGHRRTLAVVQAARSVVPVHVVARPQEVHRVIDQMSEHRHRAGLTAAEDAAWIAQG